jgi:putative transposase
MTDDASARYKRHRFPAEIIAHAVWLYYRFPLSLRDIEDLLAERGIAVSFQTVSEWTTKFGLKFAHQLKRRSIGNFADKWHLDEMVVSIKGKKYGSVAKNSVMGERALVIFGEISDERFQVAPLSG